MIKLPEDRTRNQPAIAFCRTAGCESGGSFEVPDNGIVKCPDCEADSAPTVGLNVLIHLLERKKDGPITGMGGVKWQFACDPNRKVITTSTNLESASDDPSVINCPDCRKVAEESELKEPTGPPVGDNSEPRTGG